MTAFLKLTWTDMKLFLRNALNAFFLLVYPIMILFIFGTMYGNQPAPIFGGFGSVDVGVPGYIVAMVIGTAGFLNLPVEIINYRERGILRRYRATPLKPGWVLGSQMMVVLGATLLGTTLQLIFGRAMFQAHMPIALLDTILGFFLICLSIFSLGFLIASLVKNVSSARTISMSLYFPMMFLSGGTLPREVMPAALQRFADFLPLTHAVSLFKDLWFGRGWDPTHLAVLLGVALISVLVSVRLFRWE